MFCLLHLLQVRRYIKHLSTQTNSRFIQQVFPATVQVKASVSLTFVEIWKCALVHLLDPTDFFKGYRLALTKYVLSFHSSF